MWMSNNYSNEEFSYTDEDYNVKRVIKVIQQNKGKKIVIEGSEPYIKRVLENIDLSKYPVEVNPSPRYGACDIDTPLYLDIRPDIVIHLGHNPFPNTFSSLRNSHYKIYFIPMIDKVDEERLRFLTDNLSFESNKTYGLVYSIQYRNYAEKIMEWFRSRKIQNVIIPHLTGMLRGQVLGCTNAFLRNYNVDQFIILSSGIFHALGVSLYTGIPTKLIDIHNYKVLDMRDKTHKIRSLISWNIYRAKNYNKVAVVSVADSHQSSIGGENAIIRLLKKYGISHIRYNVYRVSEEVIHSLPKEYLPVVAGCPRIAIDDITRFKRPVLNLEQLQILLGLKDFNEVYPPLRNGG